MSKQTDLVEIAQDGIVVPDASVSEAKLQVSNAPTDGYMLTAQSGNTGGLTWAEAPSSSTTYGDVGTYGIFNRGSSTATITQGSTYAGSGLYPTGFQSFVYAQGGNANNYAVGLNTSAVGTGTWRAMGRVSTTGVTTYYMPATVFVRIS